MLVAHSPDKFQSVLDCLHDAYKDLWLVVNTNKTEVMFQWSGVHPSVDQVMKINGAELRTVTQFTYLGQLMQKSTKELTRPPPLLP